MDIADKKDKKKKISEPKEKINPSKYVNLDPVLESFVGSIVDGSDTKITDDDEYTYSDLLYAVIDNNYEDFAEIIGCECEDLFDYVYEMIYDTDEFETSLSGDDMGDYDEEDLDEARQPLTLQQRRRRGQIMKRYKSKIMAARTRARKRKASPEKLKGRAKRKARNLMRQRFTQGKSYGSMSPSEKMQIDKKLARISPALINRIAQRQLPVVRKAETERMSKLNSSYENVGELIEDLNDINKLFESKFNDTKLD